MAFPPAFLDELVARNPIEEVVGQYVQLKRSGANYFGLCPFHSEKTGSFSVAPSKQIYYCFGCHKGGGVINFIMDIENLSYPDAVRFLAKRAGLEVPEDDRYQSRYREQERLWKLCREAARFYHEQLKSDAGKPGRAYLAGRGMDWQTVTKFGIGFATENWHDLENEMRKRGYSREELIAADLIGTSEKNGKSFTYDRFTNRVMFPLIDVRGNVVGFAGRTLDPNVQGRKYLNSKDTLIFSKRSFVFGLNLAKKSKQGRIILCEGPMDAIACHQFGFDCAVASQGTSLTQEQINLIGKYTDAVVMTFDSDFAGQNATQRAITMFEKAGISVKILRFEGAKDADEYLHKFGADRFQLLLDGSADQADYRLQSLKNQFDLSKDEQKVEFLKKAAELISGYPSAIEREIYGAKAAEAAGITAEAMKLEIGKAYKRRRAREQKKEEARSLSPAVQLQPSIRGIRYDNLHSAIAEEMVLRQILRESTQLEQIKSLSGAEFSSPLLGRAFDALQARYRQGLSVSLAVLEGFTPEELNHLSAVAGTFDEPVSDQALADCVEIIREEHRKAGLGQGEDALRTYTEQMKQKKGYGG